MHPFSECPEWEYQDIANHAAILKRCAKAIFRNLIAGKIPQSIAICDTRPLHQQLFTQLVPPATKYLAGHYRGEDFKCLKFRPVGIGANPLVGAQAAVVHLDLRRFCKEAEGTIRGLDQTFDLPSAHLPETEKLKYLIAVSCRLFAAFLLIHPFANGNGHVARIMLTWLLQRYGYALSNFPIEPRPDHPGYSDAIRMYQHGNVEPLELMIASALT
jgi:fido (protein-threonine AMPylation protein)